MSKLREAAQAYVDAFDTRANPTELWKARTALREAIVQDVSDEAARKEEAERLAAEEAAKAKKEEE